MPANETSLGVTMGKSRAVVLPENKRFWDRKSHAVAKAAKKAALQQKQDDKPEVLVGPSHEERDAINRNRAKCNQKILNLDILDLTDRTADNDSLFTDELEYHDPADVYDDVAS